MSTTRTASAATVASAAHPALTARLVHGVVGGVAGGMVFGMMMQMMGAILMIAKMVGSDSLVVADRDGDGIRLTHEQLADLVGTTRETVTKVLGDLAARGLVQQKRGRVIVTNRAGGAGLVTSGGLTPVIGGHRS